MGVLTKHGAAPPLGHMETRNDGLEAEVIAAGRSFGMHVVNLRLAMVYGRGGKGNLYRMARGIRVRVVPTDP